VGPKKDALWIRADEEAIYQIAEVNANRQLIPPNIS
jgi:hypothetical protein